MMVTRWIFMVLSVLLCATFAMAQNTRAPRIAHPDLLPAEKGEDINRQLDPVYDKAKDQTSHFVSGLFVIGQGWGREVEVPGDSNRRVVPASVMKMVTYFTFSGKKRVRPDKVVLAFNAGSAFGYGFGQHRDLSIQLDAEELKLGAMNLTNKYDEGHRAWGFIRYWETIELPVTVDVYKKIIESKSVGIRVGAATASLSPSQLKYLRKYAKDLE